MMILVSALSPRNHMLVFLLKICERFMDISITNFSFYYIYHFSIKYDYTPLLLLSLISIFVVSQL